jgi:hypothetical protein
MKESVRGEKMKGIMKMDRLGRGPEFVTQNNDIFTH